VPSFTGHLANYKAQTFSGVLKSVLGEKNRRWALLLTAVIMPSHFFIIPFLTDYFTFNLKFDYGSTVPFVYVIGGLLTAVFSPFIGKLSDRIGRYKTLIGLSVLALIPLIGIPNLQTHSKLVLFCFTASFFVFSGSRMVITIAHTTSTAEPQIRGAFLIINSSIQQFAISIASLIGGFIMIQSEDKSLHNYPILGYISIVFSVISLLVFNKVKALKV
jgi:predicted MFS family arabinose efflux permease